MIGTAPAQGPKTAPRKHLIAACDMGERLIVLCLYIGLVARLIAPGWEQKQLANLLLIPSEGLVVLFMLLRRRTEHISMRWQDWLLAFSATLAPMLVQP